MNTIIKSYLLFTMWAVVAYSAYNDIKPKTFTLGEIDKKPVPQYQANPEYPEKIKDSKMEGEAIIRFVVDVDGTTTDFEVESATCKEFGEAGIAAIKKWKFSPGIKDGKKVKTALIVPIVFSINDDKKKSELVDKPEEVVDNKEVKFKGQFYMLKDVDKQPIPIKQVRPEYPEKFRRQGVEGVAQVIFIVNEEGSAEQVQIGRANDIMFADSARISVSKWKFVPAEKDGRKVRVVMSVPIEFRIE